MGIDTILIGGPEDGLTIVLDYSQNPYIVEKMPPAETLARVPIGTTFTVERVLYKRMGWHIDQDSRYLWVEQNLKPHEVWDKLIKNYRPRKRVMSDRLGAVEAVGKTLSLISDSGRGVDQLHAVMVWLEFWKDALPEQAVAQLKKVLGAS